jgi:hypothetical protein
MSPGKVDFAIDVSTRPRLFIQLVAMRVFGSETGIVDGKVRDQAAYRIDGCFLLGLVANNIFAMRLIGPRNRM